MIWLNCVEGGWAWWGLTLLSASLLVFWLANFGICDCRCCQGSQSSPSSEASLTDPSVFCWPSVMSLTRAIVLWVHWSAGLIFLPLFCFINVMTWASWCNPRTAHCLCLQLAYLLLYLYDTDPRNSLSIFNVSVAQWCLACSCNYSQWGVVIHERIQLS